MVKITILILTIFSISVFSADESIQSTVNDRTGVEITIYNTNQALVKEDRSVRIPAGEGTFQFSGVASQINPATVHVESITSPSDFSTLEQNYQYDLISPGKLMEKYVGKRIKIVNWNQYQDRKDITEATLLSLNDGEVYKINNEIYLGYPGTKVLPQLPENLVAQPTLEWLYKSSKDLVHQLEVSYLTGGLSWHTDYILATSKNDRIGNLSSWVTIDNNSGAMYKDALLKLVAGQVNLTERNMPMMKGLSKRMEEVPQQPFHEEAVSEYHIYDLPRKTTLRDNQSKQISFLETNGINLKKEYIVAGRNDFFTSRINGETSKSPVEVYFNFDNRKDNKLGIPLPAGTVRIYSNDKQGRLQFVGEDNINHTPKDETVHLKSGAAFDITAEQLQTNFKQLTSALFETEWKVTLRNKKSEDVTIGVIQPMFGNWEIIGSNYEFKKTDAFTVRFDVPVPKEKEIALTYKVKVGLQ